MTAQKLLAIPVVVAILAVGVWFWSGVVAPGYWSAIVLGTLWFVACSVLFGRLGKARPELRVPLRATFLTCSVLAVFGFYWTSIRDTVVDEDVAVGVPVSKLPKAAASATIDPLAPQPAAAATDAPAKADPPRRNVVERLGSVRPASHSADGTARVVKLAAGGRRLTLSDGFEIDPGPKVRVYLATDESGTTFKDLGELKGSRGDQQYEIPASVSLTRYDTVVFWCVPFSVSLATAELRPA
jgi:hypothetical protein